MTETEKSFKKVPLGDFALAIQNSYLCNEVLKGDERKAFISKLLGLSPEGRVKIYGILLEEAKQQKALDKVEEKEMAKLRTDYYYKLKGLTKTGKRMEVKGKEDEARAKENIEVEDLLSELENL